MSAVVDRTEFLALLEQSQLLDPPLLADLRASDLPPEPGACAEQLVQQGVLTRFQVRLLMSGRFRGLVLGPYRVLDQIGKGGMGSVYLAEHAKLKRRVAIKVLARELCDDKTAVERFQREARAASALCHPNVMRVHHTGTAGGSHYLVMEYVEGATLEQLVDRKGPFTPAEAARIGVQTAAGLLHAHEKGFVHRDIKPENLMLAKDGGVKILDMGLTKDVTRTQDNLTGIMNTTAILGTIDYLSPEQGMQNQVDARSDVYSLGATLFTLITGHSPYEGLSGRQKLLHHQNGPVPQLTDFRADVPAELAAVIAKMMAKSPKDRHQTMAAAIEALQPFAAAEGDQPSDDTRVVLPSAVMKAPPMRPASLTPTVRDQDGGTRTDIPTANPALTPEPQSIIYAPVTERRAAVEATGRGGLWLAAAGSVLVAAVAAAGVWYWLG